MAGRCSILRTLPGAPSFLRSDFALSRENFGIQYVRWPYDPAVSGGELTSQNPSRWQDEWNGAVGWLRTFDPSLYGRYAGGSFVQVGTTSEGSPVPYGRIEGGSWSQGMLRSDGSYDFSKMDLLLDSAAAKGCKVLMSIGAQGEYWDGSKHTEYPLPTGEYLSTDPTAYYARWASFLDAMLTQAGSRLHALEIANEPGKLIRRNTVIGPGWTESLAILCRIAKQLIQSKGLITRVVSPPLQGGESSEVASFLNASAAGLAVNGSDGAGTFGKNWVDVVGHHIYGNFSDRAAGGSTTAMDASALGSATADTAYPNLTTFADMYAKGRAVVTAAKGAGWAGPFWNTEFNVTGAVSTGLWYPRKMTTAGFERLTYLMMLASTLSGFDLHILYAADHPALGYYDNTGTVPSGEPAEWYFKSPDGTASLAGAVAAAIKAMHGSFTGGICNNEPFLSVAGGIIRRAEASENGVLVDQR